MAMSYNPPGNLNYPGSSGYGVTSGRYGPKYTAPPASDPADRTDYPVYDPATGKVVSVKTGKAWSGAFAGSNYNQGVEVPFSNETINPNDPNQRYRPVDIIKSPAVASGAANLMDTFNKAAQSSLTDFGKVLSDFKSDTATARAKIGAAADTSGTEAALTGAQSRYTGSLDKAVSDYAAQNARQAAIERGIVEQTNALLPEYDVAAQNIGDRQIAEMRKQLSRYKLAGGTPGSLGTDEEQILARAIADVQLPLEQAKIGRRMDLLTNLALPVERELNAAEVNRIAQFNPAIAGSLLTSTQNTANTIQALRSQVAGMSMDAAIRFLQAQGIPAALINQVLAGQISNLGALGQLEEMSRYRGLQDVLGANLSQPTYYSLGTPGYPNFQPRYPGSPNPRSIPQEYVPTQTTPTGGPETPTGNPAYDDYAHNLRRQGITPWSLEKYNEWMGGGTQPGRYGPSPVRSQSGWDIYNVGAGGGYTVNPDGTVNWLGSDAWKNYEPAYGGQSALYANQ